MLIFLDTELTDFTRPDLINLALVAEDGREFDAELDDYHRDACSAFVRAADLQSQGREVRSVEHCVKFVGKVEITADGRFAVQSLGRAVVVIHDLTQLDGHYTSDEEVQIKYLDRRGHDKREEHRPDRPGGVGR